MFDRQFPRVMGLHGIMVVFIKTNIQSEMMNTITMIPCGLLSWRELYIV